MMGFITSFCHHQELPEVQKVRIAFTKHPLPSLLRVLDWGQ